jgi:hypothetical protein
VIYPGSTPVGNATLVVANVLTCSKHSQKVATTTSVPVVAKVSRHNQKGNQTCVIGVCVCGCFPVWTHCLHLGRMCAIRCCCNIVHVVARVSRHNRGTDQTRVVGVVC